VADYLQQGHANESYKKLVIAAGPEFLGTLRKLLDKSVSGAIILELNKDYTNLSPQDLQAQVKQHQQLT
jgi:protein required for attachment to host cells